MSNIFIPVTVLEDGDGESEHDEYLNTNFIKKIEPFDDSSTITMSDGEVIRVRQGFNNLLPALDRCESYE